MLSKRLFFFLIALLVSFLTAAAPFFIIIHIIEPVIKTYPNIQSTILFKLAVEIVLSSRALDFLGAFVVAAAGYVFIQAASLQKRCAIFALLLLFAWAFGWLAGQTSLIAGVLGWGQVLLSPIFFWIAVVVKFGIGGIEQYLGWTDSLIFLISSFLLFCVFIRYGRA